MLQTRGQAGLPGRCPERDSSSGCYRRPEPVSWTAPQVAIQTRKRAPPPDHQAAAHPSPNEDAGRQTPDGTASAHSLQTGNGGAGYGDGGSEHQLPGGCENSGAVLAAAGVPGANVAAQGAAEDAVARLQKAAADRAQRAYAEVQRGVPPGAHRDSVFDGCVLWQGESHSS